MIVISCLANYIEKVGKKIIFNSMTKPQFTCYPLVWMFFSGTSNDLINKTQRFLRGNLSHHEISFVELLREYKNITNYQRNKQLESLRQLKT